MPAKKGFFQKSDTKKQYSENVLNNVESAYRPKNRGRVRNPISSNTMSGEEVNDFEEPLTQMQDSSPQTRFKKPVGYAFAGPQAKRQKQDAQTEVSTPAPVVVEQPAQVVFSAPTQVEKPVVKEKLPEPEIQVRTGKPAKKKTDVAIQKRAPKKSKKLSQPEIQVRTGSLAKKLSEPEIQVRTGSLVKKLSEPEIQVRTGSLVKKLSEPEIQVRTGSLAQKPSEPEIQVRTGNIVPGPTLETSVAFELLQAAIMLEAVQELEVDVQETQGNYAPIEEAEFQAAKRFVLQNLFSKKPLKSEVQYELDLNSMADLDSIAMDEFQQTEIVEIQFQAEPKSTEETPAAELGLSFDPEAYGKDTKKTRVLNLPKQGVKRSHRGTIEAVFQPNGNIVQAHYNRCGILIEVNVGGALKLTRAADTGKWTMSYLDGSQPVNRVSGVAFDRLGNLCYSTEDGRTTVICADGRVMEK